MTRPRPLLLNIDDDAGGRYAINRSLAQAGFDVIDADTGEGGIRSAEANAPDLILLDIRLPDIDGFEVCGRLRGNPAVAGIPVLQLSASYLDVSSRVRGLEKGADAYLTKPVEPAILVATINSLLRLKRAENTVRKTAHEWQSTFDAIGNGVAVMDTEGHVTRSNHAFGDLHGLDEALANCFESVRREGRRQDCEVTLDGKTYSVTLDPVRNEEAEFEGAVCVVCDITEKKNFDAQMRQTARLESIGVLAGGIAHDFNNLLTGILGNASLLLETMPERSPDLDLVREIVKASESAADLTRQILAYSGKGRFVMTPLNLSEVAQESRTFVRRFIPQKVQLVYEFAECLPLIEADPAQMQQVLMNLIINAAESFAEGSGGEVKVTTAAKTLEADSFYRGEIAGPGEYVELSVSDTGSGMDEETKGRIFDPFFTTKFAGRGLGLSAVHGILKAHRGVLRLDSELGKGTTFRLYFPVTDKKPERVLERRGGRAAGMRSGTILVVDDESVIRNFARVALEKRGYTVVMAEDGRQGVEVLRKMRAEIQLVLLDFTMPEMNGEEAFQKMRAIVPGLPVLLSSGFSHALAQERFSGKGLAGFLGKPFTVNELNDAVDAALLPA